jgi:hypothetical protein
VAMAAMSSARRAGPALRYPPSAHRFPATVSPARLPITLPRLQLVDVLFYLSLICLAIWQQSPWKREKFQRTGQLPEDKAASRELDSFKQGSLLGQASFQRTGQLPEDRAASRGQGRF